MDYDLKAFDLLVEDKYIRKVETPDLVLYNYTEQTTYERYWNDYTRAARGIIFEKATGKLIAKPFPKFFNLGEMEETQLLKLPGLAYTVTEKMDGSLGIIYHHAGIWHVATRGSFNSPQAVKGQQLLHTQYKVNTLTPGCTYLVEIIYPENKIVVNYGDEEKLVMLGAYYEDGTEMPWAAVAVSAAFAEMPLARGYEYTIERMIELQQTMPKDREGFVVRFDNGLRVKIKGAEYLRIHKIISELSPLSAWEVMDNGVVSYDYLKQIPEEYRKDFESIVSRLEEQYAGVKARIIKEAAFILPSVDPTTKEGQKAIGLFIQSDNHGLKHPGAMFLMVLNKPDAVNKYIMKYIRPTGNNLAVLP